MNTLTQMRIAQWGHRISGLVLAAFLPVHFWFIAAAVNGPRGGVAAAGTESSIVEHLGLAVLLALLTVHAGFGLRVLFIEYGPVASPARLYLSWIWFSLMAGLLMLCVAGFV